MVMTALRDGASGGIFKYFLLGMLVMAAGGLVFMDIGGFFRGGVSGSDAAKVGKHTISIQSFDRNVRMQLSRLGMTPEKAHQVGYLREMLNGEIRNSLLQQEAIEAGVRPSTKLVASNIEKLLVPMMQHGQKPSDVLEQLLRSQGIGEQELVQSIRREITVNQLGNAIQSGFLEVSEAMVEDLARFEGETRTVEYIAFKEKDFEDVKEPADAELTEFYETMKEAYAIPETRKSQVIIIKTDKLKDSLEISDEEVQHVYERNISTYSEPEKRKIEQTIITDIDQAEEIAEAVRGGQGLKAATEKVTGNTTDYIPSKAQEKPELLDELADEVFTAEKGAVLGPIETGLGAHIVVVNDIVQPRTTPLAEVKKDIRQELEETRLLDAQYDLANTVDDYLAAGEPVETLKEELGVEVQDMPAVNSFGMDESGKAVFTPAFGPDAQILVQSLYELGEGQASPVMELADGSMGALLVTEIKDKTYRSFEDMKQALKDKWIADSRRLQNKFATDEILNKAKADEHDLKTLASTHSKQVNNVSGLKRSTDSKGGLNKATIQMLFAAKPHEMMLIDIDGGAAIAVVQNAKLPEEPDEEALTAARNKLNQEMQNEAYTLYVQSLQDDYGVKINHKLLDSVYGNAQGAQ